MIINPTFFPETKTWRIDTPIKLEAPTIREMLAKLKQIKPRTKWKAADYYPIGTETPRPVWPKAPAKPSRTHMPPNARAFEPNSKLKPRFVKTLETEISAENEELD